MTGETEITGRLYCRPNDPLALWIRCDDGSLVGLVEFFRAWIGRQVRVIVAEGKDRRWVVIEAECGAEE